MIGLFGISSPRLLVHIYEGLSQRYIQLLLVHQSVSLITSSYWSGGLSSRYSVPGKTRRHSTRPEVRVRRFTKFFLPSLGDGPHHAGGGWKEIYEISLATQVRRVLKLEKLPIRITFPVVHTFWSRIDPTPPTCILICNHR